MTIKVGINGFGRMGRLSMRAAFDWDDVEIFHINDPAGNAETFAHLMTFDSVHGKWHHQASHHDNAIIINGKEKNIESNNDKIIDTNITDYLGSVLYWRNPEKEVEGKTCVEEEASEAEEVAGES